MGTPLRVLVVEDEENDFVLLLGELRKGGYDPECRWVRTLPDVRAELQSGSFDIVISDFSLPGFDGLAVLAAVRELGRDPPFLLVSGVVGEDTAVKAMRAGAQDYIMKDKLARLVPAIQRELGEAEERRRRRRAEDALQREQERAAVTLSSIGDGVVRTDTESRVEYLNPSAERLTGWAQSEAVGEELSAVVRIVDPVAESPLRPSVEQCLRERRHVRSPDGHLLCARLGGKRPVRESAAPILGADGTPTGAVVILQDLSEQIELERRMAHLERHDPVTQLGNRRSFEDALERACASAAAEGRRHVLCLLDLDRFKVINDTCGHVAGDTMLRRVAKVLRRNAGERGMVARLGADDFGLLLPDCDLAAGRRAAEALLDAIPGARFTIKGTLCTVTASIGLVAIDASTVSAAAALAAGDGACHVARDRGGNRVHEHSPGDSAVAQLHGQMRWVARLNEALARGHFTLWAQAIEPFSPAADPPVLCELLLRLRDDSGALVAPQTFLPAAERYHLMAAIDRWVVKRTLAILSRRRAPASHATVYAMNLSGQSVGDEGFLPFVAEALRSSGVPPSCLCFEITETAAIETLAQATRFIEVLQGLGCQFALDDFGIGFSSFDYLRSMTFDFVKIDGSFVRHLDDPLQQAIVRCVNQVSHLTGRRTIAEWIEDERTATLLRDMGVDYGQGWHIARPVPFEGRE